jgi:TonB family protein
MRRVLVTVGILLGPRLAPMHPGLAGNADCAKDGGFSATPAQDEADITALMRAARDGEAKSRRSEISEILKNAGAQEPPAKPKPPIPLPVKSAGTGPVLLNSPMPSYTSKARDAKVQGVVHLRVLIGADGTVKRARVLIGLPSGLSYQAIEAALRLLFKPATVNGQPVAFWKNVIVESRLR